jgi:predicted permease
VRVVTDGYITAMGIPLKAGRDLSQRDGTKDDPVILINQTMARNEFPGMDAVGQYVRACGMRRIVGVVSDVRHLALEEGSGNEMYLPIRQCPDYGSVDLVMRTNLPPSELANVVRLSLKQVTPNLPRADFRELRGLVDKAVSPRRFLVTLLSGFAIFALILASLGIYGVVSYSVGQRTQEIGIRMALGASAGNVQAAIVRHTLMLAAIGVAIGAAASWLLAGVISGLLYDVKATDPLTYGAMLTALTVVALFAGYLPARRASRIDPAIALRAT